MSRLKLEEGLGTYLRSQQWREVLDQLDRGEEVYHLHAYADTSIHPDSLARLMARYFQHIGWPLERKIRVYPEPPGGMANLYGVHPAGGRAYFEIILTLRSDAVFEPSAGAKVEYWDRKYMESYYSRFKFRKLAAREKDEAREYFSSGYWRHVYQFVSDQRNLHGHAKVKTSLHPLDLMAIGTTAIEEAGFPVRRAVSIVYNYEGVERPKIVFLIRNPEVFMELEWQYEARSIVEPSPDPFSFVLTTDMLLADLMKHDYLQRVDEGDIDRVVEQIA